MKAAKPVEKDNKSHQNQSKKQKAKKPMVVPLPVVEVANIQTQKSEQSVGNAGFTNPNTNMNLNGVIPPVHGSQTIYDQGAEIMYRRHQESLAQTDDVNHPDTQKMEKGYRSTLNVDQGQDYNNLKSGTHLPKNLEEQAAVYQESKKTQKVNTIANTVEKPTAKKNIVNQVAVVGEDLSQSISSDKEIVTDTEVKTSTNAKSNPPFTELSGRINTTAKLQKQHEPSNKATNDAQAAAPSPANERQSMAQASQVNTMDAQEAGMFKKEDFKALLSKKIHNIKLPENEAQADEFEKHNNIEEVNKKAVGDVKKEKNAASNDIASATAAEPNTNVQPVRAVAKMPTPNVGKAPGTPNVGKAMPVKRDAGSVEQPIKEQTASIDSEMKANGVTDSMLAKSNEPSFTDALDQKNKAKNQSVTATQQFRNKENKELSQTRNDAQTQADHHIGGMHSARKGGLGNVHGEQKQTSAKDSQKRKEIADHINGIYQSSKTDVNSILNNLDKTVAEKFDKGSQVAKKEFEKHVDKEMNAYKIRRYKKAGMSYGDMAALGLLVWDKLTGLPDEINKYFDSGKALYIRVMDRFIDDIATYVTNQLNAAKTRISKGKKEVQTYVNSLSPSLRKIGKDAIAEIQSKFNALEESVNSKKEALIDVLAKKYADNIASIDTRIADLKSQNSGLVNQALNVLKNSVFAIIIEIKNTLANLLSGVMDAIQAIIMDPIGFFRNLIAGVSQGFTNFGTNIWTHLKTGFFGWLTGAMKGISLTMPEDVFSLKGVFSITTQVLGLTWGGIRAIGSRVIGEPVMKVLETGFEMVQVVRKEGVAGLWEHLKDQFADLKTTVMDTIMDIIQSQVIQAGIKWVMGLLTPVGAFIKAAMAIIDVVKFFIQRAAQIMELVKAFTDSIKAIASGNVGAVAKSIENALGRAVPVLIGFLASLLGIGGLADKVLGVIRKIRQRIENAIVKFWNFVKVKGGKLLNRLGIGKKGKEDGKDKKRTAKHNEKLEDSEVGKVINFSAEGEDHKLWIATNGNNVEVMVASIPMSVSEKLKKWENELHNLPKEEQIKAKNLLSEAKSQYIETHKGAKETDKALDNAKKQNASNDEIKKAEKLDDKVEDQEKRLSHTLQQLFSIFGEGNELKYNIQKVAFIENKEFAKNRELNLEEGKYPERIREQMLEFIKHIPELRKGGNTELRKKMVSTGSKSIRNWDIAQGAIYSPFVGEYHGALQKMRENLKGQEYIITTETGGSFLGDAVTKGTSIKNEKIKKMPIDKVTGKDHNTQQPEDIVKYVKEAMKGREDQAITFTIVEPLFSGTSVISLMKATGGLINTYPNIQFKFVTMQETLGFNKNDAAESIEYSKGNMVERYKITQANRIQVHYEQTSYVLGEDVPNHTSYKTKGPVVVFNATDGVMTVYQIKPAGETTTRDIVIALANGEFNGKLKDVL